MKPIHLFRKYLLKTTTKKKRKRRKQKQQPSTLYIIRSLSFIVIFPFLTLHESQPNDFQQIHAAQTF